jgi:hypothetical protein
VTRTAKWLPALGLILATAPQTSFAAPAAPPEEPSFESRMEGMRFRNIGPFRGGRVTAVAGVRGQRNVAYQGATGGGVWKTTDGGASWEAVSDGISRRAPSARSRSPSPTRTSSTPGWARAAIRGNVSHGDGVWRSTDAGKSWKHLGLADTMQIGRIRVHPGTPTTSTSPPSATRGGRTPSAASSARGTAGRRGRTRPLRRRQDGRRATSRWTRRTRASSTPALWQVVRTPWSLESGGPGSGLYKTTTAATPGRSSTARACRRARGAGSASRLPRPPGRVYA